jgi:hypothetical protein
MTNDPARPTSSLPAGSRYTSPFGGNVDQAIRTWWFPWSDFLNSITGQEQIGLINIINEQQAGNVEKEERIVAGVASYGKQLGRINDALNVLISRMDISQIDDSDLHQDERRALEDFSKMFKEIAAAKGESVAPTEQDLDRFLGEIRDLKGRDSETYQNMLRKMRDFAESESPE